MDAQVTSKLKLTFAQAHHQTQRQPIDLDLLPNPPRLIDEEEDEDDPEPERYDVPEPVER